MAVSTHARQHCRADDDDRMDGNLAGFFRRQQQADRELAAFRNRLRIDELEERIAELRAELDDPDLPGFADDICLEEGLYHLSGGSRREYELLADKLDSEVQRWTLLKTKETLLKSFYELGVRLAAKKAAEAPQSSDFDF